ncbi:DUF2267 domain-containing protein [Streptomyces sporangiiformans]|uniref:DUF2267 domain-containing protein n=1 Tax=Streptomyces sporangiiformans TaxID=2315329 RepID=A0A505DQP7_9ACTN|nr:DUF2267 domain-containing protein [Streptomyces sporangiiformans]TPQ23604.1 DUF2267 domain-containing protein [Streptomyces sporangiiformans]
MRHDELIGKVQAQAQLPDRGAAEHTARAVLSTLAERIPEGLADHLAAQLPSDLAESMREKAAGPTEDERRRGAGERFDLTAFAGRIAWRAGVPEDVALRQAAAVLEVLDAAVAPEEMEKLASVLPTDIRTLLPLARAEDTGA